MEKSHGGLLCGAPLGAHIGDSYGGWAPDELLWGDSSGGSYGGWAPIGDSVSQLISLFVCAGVPSHQQKGISAAKKSTGHRLGHG